MAWLGLKKLAFIPLSRTNAQPPDIIPPDWTDQIMQRVFFDRDPVTGTDRSVRAYIRTVSSGLADRRMEQSDLGSSLEKQAAEQFGELEPAECRLIRAPVTGDELDCANRKGVVPVGGRKIRAAVIRWSCINSTTNGNRTDPRGIRISGAEIVGKLDLSSLSVPFPSTARQSRRGKSRQQPIEQLAEAPAAACLRCSAPQILPIAPHSTPPRMKWTAGQHAMIFTSSVRVTRA